MTPVETIRTALSKHLVDDDGRQVTLKLLPGMTEEEIDGFERSLPTRLPDSVRDLLRMCRGIYGVLEGIDFTGESMDFEQADVFPHGLPIAHDGYGNFWVVDLTPESSDWGPIYFACHDAPVILYQSDDLSAFLTEVFRMLEPPHQSLVDDVHEDRLCNVWGTNPGTVAAAEAEESGDSRLAAFAEALGEGWFVTDLRNATPGQGFSWGRFGPQTEIRRDGIRPIFAYKKSPRKKLFGLFG
ncbi:MAG TPA: SMI1/KNR4 family protein [Fimbriimonas sp.]